MDKRAEAAAMATRPVAALAEEREAFLRPLAEPLLDERLPQVLVQGIVGSQSQLVTAVARGVAREQEHVRP